MGDETVIQDGLGHAVGWSLGVFYADDGILGSRYPECLKGALNILIGLFWRIRLADNVEKLNTMTFQLGKNILAMSEEEFGWSSTGKGATYWEWLERKTTCQDCGLEMAAGSMKANSQQLH